MEVLGGIALVAIVVLVIATAKSGADLRRVLVDALAVALDGTADHAAQSARGTRRGVPTWIRYLRPDDRSDVFWTVVECTLPAGYPLSFQVRRRRAADGQRLRSGAVVDLAVGDPRFDDPFLVDGVPGEVVRRLLTPEVRGYLLSQTVVELDAGDGRLRLWVSGWLDEREAIAAIDCAAGICAQVRDASADADAAVPRTTTQGPYRPIPDDAPLRAARAARAAEVAAREARRPRRDKTGDYAVGAMVALVIVLIIVGAR
jgi:hypothetical protein